MPSNPVLGTDPVRYEQVETATFSAKEAIRFLHAAENDSCRPRLSEISRREKIVVRREQARVRRRRCL
jgi:hypothetical protein